MDQRVDRDETEHAYSFVPSAPPHVSRRWLLRIGVVITIGALLAAAWALLSSHRAAAQLVEATEAQALVSVATTHPEPVTGQHLLDAIAVAHGGRVRIFAVPMAVTHVAAVACDVVGRIVRKPLPLNMPRYAALDAEGFVCRVERLRDVLGVVAATGLRDGIAKTTVWYREAGWLK